MPFYVNPIINFDHFTFEVMVKHSAL